MKIFRPENPAPLTAPRQRPGSIAIRFVVLLAIVVVVLALVWNR